MTASSMQAAAWQIDPKDLQFCKDVQGDVVCLLRLDDVQVTYRPCHHMLGLCAPEWQLAELLSCSLVQHAQPCASLSPSSCTLHTYKLPVLPSLWGPTLDGRAGRGQQGAATLALFDFALGSCSPFCTSVLHLYWHTCGAEPAAGFQGCVAAMFLQKPAGLQGCVAKINRSRS